jgi:hypothetical protein
MSLTSYRAAPPRVTNFSAIWATALCRPADRTIVKRELTAAWSRGIHFCPMSIANGVYSNPVRDCEGQKSRI